MEKIASFTIDHIKLEPGVYVSRKDTVGSEVITTFDLRMTSPNDEPGSPDGTGTGKITVIDGVDPKKRQMTGGGDEEDEEERIDFCVASVKKKDLKQ